MAAILTTGDASSDEAVALLDEVNELWRRRESSPRSRIFFYVLPERAPERGAPERQRHPEPSERRDQGDVGGNPVGELPRTADSRKPSTPGSGRSRHWCRSRHHPTAYSRLASAG